MFDKVKQYLRRRQKPINFEEPLRVEPLNRNFGVAQGKPIDRYYIENFLQAQSSLIRGDILEISEDTYTRKFARNPFKSRIFTYDHTDTNADLTGDLCQRDQLPHEVADCFICTQTLNFIPQPQKALAGIYQLLKPHGVLLGTVGGLSQISQYDASRWGDYWRFTRQGLNFLLKNSPFQHFEIKIYGNLAAVKLLLDGVPCEQIKNLAVLDFQDDDYPVILGFMAHK